MGRQTKIGWCHATWNLWRGCAKVSEECRHCYAEALSKRNPLVLGQWGPDSVRVVATGQGLDTPQAVVRDAINQGERRRLFVNSLADVFEDHDGPVHDHRGEVAYIGTRGQPVHEHALVSTPRRIKATLDHLRGYLLERIVAFPQIDFLLLTKRPGLILDMLRRIAEEEVPGLHTNAVAAASEWLAGRPPRNAWVGTTVGAASSTGRIDQLAEVPAACRFVSFEPLLEWIDLSPWLNATVERDRGYGFYRHLPTCPWTAEGGCSGAGDRLCNGEGPVAEAGDPFHWAIIGGESGPGARPFDPSWANDMISVLQDHGVPVFMKQLGSNPTDRRVADPKGEDPAEWPPFLRVQEFPAVDGVEQP